MPNRTNSTASFILSANRSVTEEIRLMNTSTNATWNSQYNSLVTNPALQYFFVIALALQGLLGTFGNLLVIGAISVVPALRTASNAFILNLSLADLMVTCVTQPSSILGALLGQDYFDRRPTPCSIVGTLCAMGCLASTWNICMISINRFIMICYFELYHKIYTKVTTVAMCAFVWIIVFIINLPNHTGWGHTQFSPVFYVCTFANHVHSYAVFFIGVGVFIPVTCSFLAYVGIYLKVRNSSLVRNRILMKRETEPEGKTTETALKTITESARPSVDPAQNMDFSGKPRQSLREFHRNVRVAKALFRVFVIFLIMWLPVAVVILLGKGQALSPVWYILTVLMAHGNSSINCVVYALSLDHFREGYMRLVGVRRKSIHPGKSNGPVSTANYPSKARTGRRSSSST